MKFLVTIFLMLIVNSSLRVIAQSTVDSLIIPFKYKAIEGIILLKDYQILMPNMSQCSWFTPSRKDIIFAEKYLKSNIKEINTPVMLNQGGDCPIIHKKLKHYFRQYSGLNNAAGDKILNINMLWNRYTLFDKLMGNADSCGQYKTGYTKVLDGCSHFWQISINLNKNEVAEFSVDGAG